MAAVGLPAQAQKQYTALMDDPDFSQVRRLTLQMLMAELQVEEERRDSLWRKGGGHSRSKLWDEWRLRRTRATECKTAIKHLLNLWAPRSEG